MELYFEMIYIYWSQRENDLLQYVTMLYIQEYRRENITFDRHILIQISYKIYFFKDRHKSLRTKDGFHALFTTDLVKGPN